MNKDKILRGVLVTNHGGEWEAVVLAVEAHPWHKNPAAAAACRRKTCLVCHRAHDLDGIIFDFESRRVYSKVGGLCTPIPPEDLAKFNADFGTYYNS